MIAINSIPFLNTTTETWARPDGEPGPVAADVPRSRRATLRVVARACRPRQWSKNVLLLAAPTAAGVIGVGSVQLRVAGAIIAFCMLSSATYLLNDVRDLDQDRRHPRKRLRPIAAGDLAPRTALRISMALGVGGLVLATIISWKLAAVGGAYVALTTSYSLWWRHLIGLDILAIAGCFVLRAAAGGAAADVRLSRWFLVVTSCCAVFVVAGKRYAELLDSDGPALTRATLRRYSSRFLQAVLAAAAAGALIAYTIWAIGRPEHGPWYELTILPFVAGLGRYGVRLARGAGEAPEEVILRDPVLLALGLAWTVLFICGIYVGR